MEWCRDLAKVAASWEAESVGFFSDWSPHSLLDEPAVAPGELIQTHPGGMPAIVCETSFARCRVRQEAFGVPFLERCAFSAGIPPGCTAFASSWSGGALARPPANGCISSRCLLVVRS